MNKNQKAAVGIFVALFIATLLAIILHFCPIESPNHIPYESKKIISEDHFNGTYLNDNIVARRSSLHNVNRYRHMQIMNKDMEWKDFMIGESTGKNENFYEDARIFETDDKLYPRIIMWTQFEGDIGSLNTTNFTLYASLMGVSVRLVNPIKLHDVDNPTAKQKNWILLNSDNLSDTHWSQWMGPVHKVVRVNMFTGEIRNGWETPGVPKLRGGTPLFEYKGKLYGVCHMTKYLFRKISCKLVEIDKHAPYKIKKTSEEFTFEKNPRYEFPCGIKFDGVYVHVLLGVDDKKLIEIKMKIGEFISHLKPI